jgi:hypothetical protein
VQTPLASFLISPLLQTGVFIRSGATAECDDRAAVCTVLREQQHILQQLQQSRTQSRLPASVILSLPVTALSFGTPPPTLPIRPEVIRPSSTGSAVVTSLAASLAPVTESTSVATEPAVSSAPTSSAALSTSQVEPASSTDDSSDNDPDRFITVPRMATPPSPAQD